ncbi:MAG: hypothetical protein DI529_09865 [Chryseobacterium sp.]|nr:MAG: hypothetical protein DI529_09865 [Chryseobacterium sp.]
MVNKKILEKLCDKELEVYISPESRFVSEARIYAFEILKSRDYNFSKEQIEIRDFLINEKKLTAENTLKTNDVISTIILTPFIIVFGLLSLLLIFISINYLFIDNNGGNAMGGTFAFIGLIVIFFILSIEQIILKIQNFKKENIWWIESLIILSLVVYIYINGFSIG